jgi:energy-coupling factor transporter ATP-binding protein EcfA2
MSLVARDLAVAPPGAPDPVVRGFSLELKPGEWVALSGANGCGKTSVALALAGLVPAFAGEVTLDGEPIARARERGAVAVVLQEPSSQLLEPTVAEELAFTARNLAMPGESIEREVRRWVERFGLEPDLGLDPRALSAGRQQLVLLAAALVSRPRFLAADEACAHLDAAARAGVMEELRRAVGEGLGVLWVTQDEGEIALADRPVILGAASVPTLRPQFPVQRPPAEIALRLTVAPWDGVAGPHVACREPLAIDVPATGVTALVGPNGAGKSVLLSAAAGLLRLDQIDVSPKRLDPPAILSAQYPELQMFEERVADEVAFAAVSRGAGREAVMARAARAFERLGLTGEAFLGRRAFELSAGEKRLVQAVGALLAPASAVLLDEPTAGLDPGRMAALAALVVERAATDPVIVASQDQEWLEWLGSRTQSVGATHVNAKASERAASPDATSDAPGAGAASSHPGYRTGQKTD